MSIAIRQRTLARRRTRVFRGIGEKMYGRIERASATGSPFSGSAATGRSYLANHLDHCIRPVTERVIANDSPPQLAADLVARLLRGCDDACECRGECIRIARRRDELERQAGQE